MDAASLHRKGLPSLATTGAEVVFRCFVIYEAFCVSLFSDSHHAQESSQHADGSAGQVVRLFQLQMKLLLLLLLYIQEGDTFLHVCNARLTPDPRPPGVSRAAGVHRARLEFIEYITLKEEYSASRAFEIWRGPPLPRRHAENHVVSLVVSRL